MALDDDFINELRLQTAILKAAHRQQLDALAEEVRADEISCTVMELLEPGAMAAGVIRTQVIARVKGAAERTIIRRLGSLVETGVIRRTGKGSLTSYELTGLF